MLRPLFDFSNLTKLDFLCAVYLAYLVNIGLCTYIFLADAASVRYWNIDIRQEGIR